MSKFGTSIAAAALLLCTANAQAVLIDLKADAEPGGTYGESAWNVFHLLPKYGIDVDIYGMKDGAPVFAYLDSNKAGMGVCGELNTGDYGHATHSGDNLCKPSDDDNVTSGEMLVFVFNEPVVIDKLWFNNNHDGDKNLFSNTISIFGIAKTFMNPADVDASRGGDVVIELMQAFAGGGFSDNIAYYSETSAGEQFYLSAMEIHRAPEPATLALLATALAGLGFARRKLR